MIWKRDTLRAVLGSWAIVLAVSVAPVYSAGNGGGDQSNPEPNDGGGYCIDCNEYRD